MGSSVQPHQTANTQSWIQCVVPEILLVQCNTTPGTIIEAIRLQFGKQASYRAAEQCNVNLVSVHA